MTVLAMFVPRVPSRLPVVGIAMVVLTVATFGFLLLDVRLERQRGTRLLAGGLFPVGLTTASTLVVVGSWIFLRTERYGEANIGLGLVFILGLLSLPIGPLIHVATSGTPTDNRGSLDVTS